MPIGTNHFLQNAASNLGKDERFGFAIVVGEAIADGSDQLRFTRVPMFELRTV